jgi:hypothetical protein
MISISIALAAALSASASAKAACKADSYQQLAAEFPHAVKYDPLKARVESVQTTPVMSSHRATRCAMEKARKSYGILGYDVRYDEGEVIGEPISFTSLRQIEQ